MGGSAVELTATRCPPVGTAVSGTDRTGGPISPGGGNGNECGGQLRVH